MAKQIYTRIQNKHDLTANWAVSDLVPLVGEIIIYDAEGSLPAKVKIGDGINKVNDLPFFNTGTDEGSIASLEQLGVIASAYELNNTTGTTRNIQTQINELNAITADHAEQLENATLASFLALPGSLKWDGIIGAREYITVSSDQLSDSMSFSYYFVHISDDYPDEYKVTGELAGCYAIGSPGAADCRSFSVAIDSVAEMSENGSFIISTGDMPIIVISENNTVLDGITFTKKGIWAPLYSITTGGVTVPIIYLNSLYIFGHIFAGTSDSAADKYFETKLVDKSYGDTLNFLEITDWLDQVDFDFVESGFSVICYKVSDQILKPSDLSNGCFVDSATSFGGTDYETQAVPAEEAQALFQEDGLAQFGSLVNVPYAGYNYDGLIFPSAGLWVLTLAGWFMSSKITIPGYTFIVDKTEIVIKTKHLPEALRFGDIGGSTGSDTVINDGPAKDAANITALTDVLIKVSDSTPTIEDLQKGFTFSIYIKDVTEEATELITITPEDIAAGTTEFEIVADPETGIITVASGLPFLLISPTSTVIGENDDGTPITLEKGTYLLSIIMETTTIKVTSITINGYTGFSGTKLVTIDPKYLPIELPIMTKGGSSTLTWDGNKTGLAHIGDYYYKISDVTPTVADLENGVTVTVNTSNEGDFAVLCFPTLNSDGSLLSLVNGSIIECVIVTRQTTVDGITYSKGTYFRYAQSDMYITRYTKSIAIPGYIGFGSSLVIDPKYLPTGYAGSNSAITADIKAYVDDAITTAIGNAISASY